MTPVLTTERKRPSNPSPLRARATAIVIGAVLGILMLVLLVQLEGPRFVDDVTVVNGTAYRLNVAVSSDDDGDGVVQLGAIGRGDDNRFEAVLDQGDVWVFRFDYGGVDAGELLVTSEDLEALGRTIEIPPSTEQLLRDSGLEPSAQYL